LFDDLDVNSNKLGSTVAKRNEKLVKWMNGVSEMKLGNYQEHISVPTKGGPFLGRSDEAQCGV